MLGEVSAETLSGIMRQVSAAQVAASEAMKAPGAAQATIETDLVGQFRKILETQLGGRTMEETRAPTSDQLPPEYQKEMADMRKQMVDVMAMVTKAVAAIPSAKDKDEDAEEHEEPQGTKVFSLCDIGVSIRRVMDKLLKDPLVERRGVTSMAKFDGSQEKYKDWHYHTKALFDREPWLRALVKAVEANSLQKDLKKVDIQSSHLEFVDPVCGTTMVMSPSHWLTPEIEIHHLVIALSENVYQVLQVLLEGSGGLICQNLEMAGPSRGFETWANLHRNNNGENGPRVLGMCDAVFYPQKAKMDDLNAAVATHEAAVKKLMAGDTQSILKLMTI